MKYSALWLVGKYLKHTTYSVMSGQGARRKQTLLRRVESGGAGDQHLGIRDAGVVSSTLSLQVEQIQSSSDSIQLSGQGNTKEKGSGVYGRGCDQPLSSYCSPGLSHFPTWVAPLLTWCLEADQVPALSTHSPSES